MRINWRSGSLCFVAVLLLSSVLITTASAFSTDTLVHGIPVQIADTFSFTEGPAVDAAGNVYFTDQPNNRILKYDLSGKLTVFLQPAGRANGMYFDREDNLLACADEKGALWCISPEKRISIRVKDFYGARLNGPNDLWIAPDGGMYITDPYYQRKYWTRTAPDPAIRGQYVYYLPKGDSILRIADSTLVQPNGIIGTPDGKYLYVADIKAGKTYKYDIAADGSLYNKTLFAEQGSDGMTIDEKGNIYLTGKGVTIYNAQGRRTGHIAIPEPWTANVCFYGEKRNYLFVTASEAVYLVKMSVSGVP